MRRKNAPYSKFHVNLSEEGKKKREAIDLNTGKIIRFDSEEELKFYNENIVPGIKYGDIVSYELHEKYELQPSFKYNNETIRAITYEADFSVIYPDGHKKVYDVKGSTTFVDNVALLKRKLFRYKYPDIDYVWVVRTSKGWEDFDEVDKELKAKKKINKAKKKGLKGK